MEEKLCKVCYTELNNEMNFCPACGEPLNDVANEICEEQKQNIELDLLMKLTEYVKDENTLKFINGLINKLVR